MDPSIVGARLASSFVTPLVKRLFRQDGPGADLVQKPVKVSRLVSFRGEKKTLTDKDLSRIAEQLVERAAQSIGPHDQLPPYELRAATHALAYALRCLGDLDLDDIQAVNLGHRDLARRLARGAPGATVGLSTGAVALYETVLETSCLHILQFFTQRTAFTARTLVEQSRQLAGMSAKIDELISRTPSPADAEFEERYTRYVADKYSELTIFGLDLTDSPDRWRLDAAYLSLDAVTASTGNLPAHTPADQVLSGRDRVLLRGVAGSGKTTLVQWLAVAAANKIADERLIHLYGLVPLVLPLRTLTRGGSALPRPDEFLAAVGCPLASAQPVGWMDRILTSGRALLLIDGIDEVPEDERRETRNWLRDLLRVFPKGRWLITSRPSAVRDHWLASEGFTELDLAPMSRDDVAAFIHRWHEAAGGGETFARSLLRAIWAKADLGRLATNPLMCALVCALHRDRRGYLPEGRKELYDAALSMLLARRDRERGIHKIGMLNISEAPQVQLIQKFAYWMIKNGRSEMDRSDAMDLLSRTLPTMPRIAEQGTPEEIYRHLLIRSGVLREPNTDTVDFIHRTFQDYLGAKAAVEELDFELLVGHAHLDQWEDVVRMAVSHARPEECARFLTSLIARGDESQGEGNRLHLLAAACLEHTTELDPAVRESVHQRTKNLIPPRSVKQSLALAEVGPVVLELLPGPAGLSEQEMRFTVLLATRIGTDAALPVLTQYREVESLDVRTLLVNAWNRFDTQRYTEEVISHVAESELYFPVSNRRELQALAALGGRPRIELGAAFPPEVLREEIAATRLTHLRFAQDMDCGWEWLSRFHNLHTVSFANAATVDVTSLARVGSLRVVEIPPEVNVVGGHLLPDHVSLKREG